jgi:hypothetical protein
MVRTYESFAEGLFRVFRTSDSFLGLDGREGATKLPTSDERSPWFTGKGAIAARNAFHDALLRVQDALAAYPEPLLLSAADVSATSFYNLAIQGDQDAIAYRYAMKALNPFVVLRAESVYEPHNEFGELNLFASRTATPAGMTLDYLLDRGAFLAVKNAANTLDAKGVDMPDQLDNWRFVDLSQNYAVTAHGQVPLGPIRIAAFGARDADLLEGGNQADRLYGGRGTDVLVGNGGADYLEGGKGFDVYQYQASRTAFGTAINDGSDEIRDTDGLGVIRYGFTSGLIPSTESRFIGGVALKVGDGQWSSPDGKLQYSQQVSNLQVSIHGDAGGSVRILDFDYDEASARGHFGIRFVDVPAPPETVDQAIVGDLLPVDPPLTDSLGNPVVTATVDPGRTDTLNDSAGSDLIQPGEGNDVVNSSRGGADWIRGAGGRDWITDTGGGNDFIEGGGDSVTGGDVG